jgi:hypothetical protein
VTKTNGTVTQIFKYYEKLYYELYGHQPVINRYKEKWGMTEVLKDLGGPRVKELLDMYFRTSHNKHTLQDFYYNYDKLIVNERLRAQDKERRARIMEQTRKRTEDEQ